MPSPPEPPDLTPFADALRVLKPAPVGLDRDGLMFRAGQASARRGWLWPAVSAALLLVCCGLASLLAVRPQTVVEGRIIRIPAEAPPPSIPAPEPGETPLVGEPAPDRSEAPAGDDYLRLRQRVVDRGVEALPRAPTWSAPPAPSPDDSLLDGTGSMLRRRHELFSGGSS